QPDATPTIKEIADNYGISRNHLMKVANGATQAGYVEGVRGRAGGLRLAKRPDEINIGAVLRAVEEGAEAFQAVLDRYSLADVVRKKSVLVQMLGLTGAPRKVRRAPTPPKLR